MTQTQALKIIQKALKPALKKLAFSANLYEAGSREPFAVRAHAEREQIKKALGVLAGPRQLEMFDK